MPRVRVRFQGRQYETLAKQTMNFWELDSEKMSALITEPGSFACVLLPGTLLALPAGRNYVTCAPLPSMGVRWGFMANRPGEDAAVRLAVAKILEARPTLASTQYQAWHDILASD